MADPNVIRLVHRPGVIMELRTAGPVPAAGYEHVGKMAQAGAGLAALMTGASGAGARETEESDG